MCSTWVSGGKLRGGLGAEFVQAARPLAAAGDENRGFLRIESELFGRLLARRQVEDFRADRRAGGDRFATREKRLGRLQPEQDLRAKPAGQHVGAAGPGVRIVDEGLQAELVAGINRRQRGEPAHAEHRVGPEIRAASSCTARSIPRFSTKTAACAARASAVSPPRAPSRNAGAGISPTPRHPPSFRKSAASPR